MATKKEPAERQSEKQSLWGFCVQKERLKAQKKERKNNINNHYINYHWFIERKLEIAQEDLKNEISL